MSARMTAENTVDAMHSIMGQSDDDSQAVEETPPNRREEAEIDETESEGKRPPRAHFCRMQALLTVCHATPCPCTYLHANR